jgi:hypothetical protein
MLMLRELSTITAKSPRRGTSLELVNIGCKRHRKIKTRAADRSAMRITLSRFEGEVVVFRYNSQTIPMTTARHPTMTAVPTGIPKAKLPPAHWVGRYPNMNSKKFVIVLFYLISPVTKNTEK